MRIIFISLLTCFIVASAALGQHGLRDLALPEYVPLSDEMLEAQRQRVFKALETLSNRMAREPQGATWLNYAGVDELRGLVGQPMTKQALIVPEIDEAGTDSGDQREKLRSEAELIQSSVNRLTGIEKGLEMPEVKQVRTALYQLAWMRYHGESSLKTQAEYNRRRDLLRVAAQSPSPTAVHRGVFPHMLWLARHDQCGSALATIRRAAKPNLLVEVGDNAMRAITTQPVYETKPIAKYEDGRQITGQAVVSGTAHLKPFAFGQPGECRVEFSGNVNTTLNGSQGPVSFGLSGFTNLHVEQSVIFQRTGFHLAEVQSQAGTAMRTDRVCTKMGGVVGKLIRTIATKKIGEEHPKASAQISQESSTDFVKGFGQKIAEEIAEANADFQNEFLAPLDRLHQTPHRLDFVSDTQQLQIQMLMDGNLGLAALNSPPPVAKSHDLAASIHESVANCFLDEMLAGRRVKNLEAEIKRLGIKLSEEQRASLPKDFKIQFARELPFYVEFDRDGIDLWICGAEYDIGNAILDGMRIHLRYRFEQRAGAWFLTRDGETEVTPLDQPSLRFLAQKNVLLTWLERELPKELPVKPFQLSSPLDRLGQIAISGFESRDGWLVAQLIGDRRPKPSKSP